MKKIFSILFLLFTFISLKAQVPNFGATMVNYGFYGYTSMKARPGMNAQETYTTLQFRLGKGFSTGTDLYTSNNEEYFGLIARYGAKINKHLNLGVQVTPSFDLRDNFKFSYCTNALYANGAITSDGKFHYTSDTWWTLYKGAKSTLTEWLYLGYTFDLGKGHSITPMPGIIFSWKFDQDPTIPLGVYYSWKNMNLYVWGDKFSEKHPRFTIGIDWMM